MRYNSINSLLVKRFGERVYKLSVASGFGCPNRDGSISSRGCSFCSEESLRPSTSKELQATNIPIFEQVARGAAYIRRRHDAERVIAYFQEGSNTYAPPERAASLFSEAISHPSVVGLAVSTRPDCVEPEHAEMLESLSRRCFLWVELGLQSAHDETLKRINRGHGAESFTSACRMLKAREIPVCAHVILGLPGEGREMMMETARFLNRTGVWGVKIHNLHILRGTTLEREYNEGGISVPSLEEYAGLACDFLEELSPSIVIHRLNAHGPRRLTVAPEWSINKLAVMNAVHSELARRESRQGIRFQKAGS